LKVREESCILLNHRPINQAFTLSFKFKKKKCLFVRLKQPVWIDRQRMNVKKINQGLENSVQYKYILISSKMIV